MKTVEPDEEDKSVKTTINLPADLWKKFSIKTIDKYGGRRKTDIFEALADAFVNTPHRTIEEAIDAWIKDKEKKKHKTWM